ncbi:Alpha-N-acetylgalactosaminide alpha-2,6-sialyltransferase 1 [Labeo rohita]|uniref:alpha-N-acetylgalactosaminide alpha-2,6-sialyltransferase n=1 Tax=Labeo rohita TaxID=84645 RepID=A0ABQ8M6H5_LABRO|nr:Alpha-N-acetylgalactosaminide alpha-2,6-sialyltransferase 1 [Labeo rohita]
MDGTTDLFWPAMLFTLLAILVAAVFLGRNKAPAPSKCSHQTSAVAEERAGPDPGASSQYHEKHSSETKQDVQSQSNAKRLKTKDETVEHVKDSNSDHLEKVCESDSTVHSFTGWGEDSLESGIRNALRNYAQSPDAEKKPLRYMAGMLRTCQLEKMMTKEELEEEQRAQREQLAAIFQLLKDKQDTFGEKAWAVLSLILTCCMLLYLLLWENLSEQFHSKTVTISALILSRLRNTSLHIAERPIFPTEKEVSTTPIPILYKNNFTKLPEWDFEDVYLRNSEARRPTCPKSLQNTEDPKFKEAVLPDIQLWLYKNLLNITEWNRLAHFNNPFGFMEYKYNVDLIPKPSIFLPVPENSKDGCIRCAVVGTGGILNNSKMGKEIDSHDYVFRVNGAVIQGYEEDVGNKTSVYVHTSFSMYSNIITLKKYGFNSIPLDKGKASNGSFKGVSPLKYFKGNFNESRFYVLHPDFLRYIRNRIFLAITLITLLLVVFVTFYEFGNVGNDSLQRVEEPDPNNSSAVTDEGANTTMSPDPLGTQSTPLPVMDKHNFTALPQWKFDDMYRLDPQFKQSECTASLRNSTNPVFKEKFIPNIQLFLQSDHLNISEWNWLYHFNNPFGYMGLNYTAIKAAVDTIPKLASTQLLQASTRVKDGCIRCAVVGTSGILNGPRKYYSGHFNESSYYILHPDFLRYVRNKSKQLNTKRWWLVRPTNGAFTLLLAMHTCDIVRVYGFSTTDYQKYSNYYYDSKHTKLVFYANHDYRLEMKTWKKFHDEKVIWMYLGKSDM